MSPTIIISIIKYCILIYLSMQSFLLTCTILSKSNEITMMTQKAVDNAIGKTDSFYFNRDNLTAIMSKYGLMAMLNDYNLEPSTFIMIKFGIGIIFAFFGVLIIPGVIGKIVIFVVAFLIGFVFLDQLLKIQNKSDNDDMNDDIIQIYSILKTNAKADEYIIDSLIECQRSISNKRLKQALNELNNNVLSSRVTPDEAVDIFNSRFDNQHIDNLAIIIKQSLKTGRTTTMLSDISKQIQIMNNAKSAMMRDKIKRKTAGIQVAFFVILSAAAIYLIGIQMLLSLKTI